MLVLSLMRLLVASGIVVALLSPAWDRDAPQRYRGPCGESVLPAGTVRLSAPIRIETSCGSFAITADGVRFIGVRRASPTKDGFTRRGGKLELLEHGRVVWRSRERHPRHALSALVARDRGSIAFQYFGRPLYLVGGRGAERPIAGTEFPLGWTRAGFLLTATGDGSAIVVRDRRGRKLRTLSAGNGSRRFDQRSRKLLFVSGERLLRTDGRMTETVADLSPYRLGRWTMIESLRSGRLALVGKRIVVLTPNGDFVSSDLSRAPISGHSESAGGDLAVVSTQPMRHHRRSREAIRVLRAGDRSSSLLFVHEFTPRQCAHAPFLQWRGKELLYTTTEGHVVVIDPRSGDHIDLTGAVARLPGTYQFAGWA